MVNFFLFILKKESNRLKEEIASRDLQGHLIFVNLIAVLYIGWCCRHYNTHCQRQLVYCSTTVKNGHLCQVCRCPRSGLCTEWMSLSLLATMKEGAIIDEANLNLIKIAFPKLLSIMCNSHTLARVGNRFKVPDLLSFGSLHMQSQSKAKLTSRTYKSYSGDQIVVEVEVFPQIRV